MIPDICRAFMVKLLRYFSDTGHIPVSLKYGAIIYNAYVKYIYYVLRPILSKKKKPICEQ